MCRQVKWRFQSGPIVVLFHQDKNVKQTTELRGCENRMQTFEVGKSTVE